MQEAMEMPKSKVYVLLDEKGNVVRIEGGYTMSNIDDLSKWTYVDEGYGDRYNLCQAQFVPKPLYTMDGIPQYKLVDNKVVERTAEEIETDRLNLPAPAPTEQERLRADVDFIMAMGGYDE